MRYFLAILLLASFNMLKAQGPGLLPVKINYKWGFADLKGNLVIPARYDRAGEFGNFSYAPVQINKMMGTVDSDGKEIIAPEYKKLAILDNLLIKVSNDSLWGLRKTSGEVISPLIYSEIEKLSHFFIVREGTQWGILNERGIIIIPPAYDSISYNKAGFFIFRKGNKIAIANSEAVLLTECKYSIFSAIDSNLILIKDNNASWSGINKAGTLLFKDIYSSKVPGEIKEYIQFGNDSLTILYSKKSGKIIFISAMYDLITTNENFIYTVYNRKMGIIDTYGKVLSEPIYRKIEFDPRASLFKINKEGKWGLMNKEGKILLSPTFDIIGKFRNGISKTRNGTRWGIINMYGKIIHPCTADRVDIKELEAEVYANLEKVFFTFDKNGNVIDKVTFKKIKTLTISNRDLNLLDPSNKAFMADSLPLNSPEVYGWFKKNLKWGLRDSTGRLWIPPFIDDITLFPDLGLTLVSVNSTERGSVSGFGVVDNEKRKFLLRPGAGVIHIEDFEKGSMARILLSSGPALLKRDGTLIRHLEVREAGKTKLLPIGYIGDFSEDVARINVGGSMGKGSYEPQTGQWGYIDREGTYVIDPKFQYANDFQLERAIVKLNNQWGLINKLGEFIIPNKYDGITYVPNTNDSLLYLENNRKKSGTLNKEGKINIAPKYEDIGTFYEGLAKAKENGRWGYINENGDTLTDFKFSDAKDFHQGYAAVKIKNKFGYIDSLGKIVLSPDFDAAGDFNGGISCVRKKGKFGYINKEGTLLIQLRYINASDFHGKFASARTKRKYGIMNMQGKWMIKPTFKKVEFCENDYAIVKKKKYGMINAEGKQILKCKYKKVEPFSEGLACVTTKKDMYGFIDSAGSMVIPAIYRNAGNFKEGLAKVLIGNKYGYINKNGIIKIEPVLKKCSDFKEGKAYVSTDNSNGFIDSSGRFLFSLNSFSPFFFSEGFALIKDKETYFFMNSKGELPFSTSFKMALPFKYGMAIVNYKGEYGVIDSSGMVVINPKYDMIKPFKEDHAELIKLKFKGIANRSGKIIMAPDFEVIRYLDNFKIFKVERGDSIGYLDPEGHWIWTPSK